MVSVNNGHVKTRRFGYTVRITQGANQVFLNFEDKEEFDFFCNSFSEAYGAGEPVELFWIRNEELKRESEELKKESEELNQSEEPVAAF